MDKAQYEAAGIQAPGAIRLFRMGDFYEAFFDDAELIGRVLGLAITRRNGDAMAGFPYHQLDAYLRKLIAAGHRVAVCEQVDGKAGHGKKVEKQVTPGILAD